MPAGRGAVYVLLYGSPGTGSISLPVHSVHRGPPAVEPCAAIRSARHGEYLTARTLRTQGVAVRGAVCCCTVRPARGSPGWRRPWPGRPAPSCSPSPPPTCSPHTSAKRRSEWSSHSSVYAASCTAVSHFSPQLGKPGNSQRLLTCNEL